MTPRVTVRRCDAVRRRVEVVRRFLRVDNPSRAAVGPLLRIQRPVAGLRTSLLLHVIGFSYTRSLIITQRRDGRRLIGARGVVCGRRGVAARGVEYPDDDEDVAPSKVNRRIAPEGARRGDRGILRGAPGVTSGLLGEGRFGVL